MPESLFVLAVIFAVYVASSRALKSRTTAVSEEPIQPSPVPKAVEIVQKKSLKTDSPPPKPKTPPKATPTETASAKKATAKPAPLKTESKTPEKTIKSAPKKPVAVVPAPSQNLTPGKISLKNPATGEIAPPFSNYRFTKRWIKEALVTEGLAQKVYGNNELTDAIEANLKEAVAKLESLKKYQS